MQIRWDISTIISVFEEAWRGLKQLWIELNGRSSQYGVPTAGIWMSQPRLKISWERDSQSSWWI